MTDGYTEVRCPLCPPEGTCTCEHCTCHHCGGSGVLLLITDLSAFGVEEDGDAQ